MYEKYAKHFNDEITEGIKEFAYDKALEKSRYIFIRREGNKKKIQRLLYTLQQGI